jgi:hypothetical protein
MYRSRAVYEACSTQQMLGFTFCSAEARRDWDDSCAALQPVAPPSHLDLATQALEDAAAGARSSFMYARVRFPPPMAQREYLYARRVWAKSDDGGCYAVSRACPYPVPPPPPPGCRTYRVDDFANGFVIRCVNAFRVLSGLRTSFHLNPHTLFPPTPPSR